MQTQTGEIEYCDVELTMTQVGNDAMDILVEVLEGLGAPKGSKLVIENSGATKVLGKAEGLAVYLNGTELPTETYQQCDSNFVHSEMNRLLAGLGRVLSYWQGPTETAFYLYGQSFQEMNNCIATFLSTYPLCQQCRVTQIA